MYPRHPSCESFVQPQALPPIHSHQVPEPLVGKLVLDHLGNALLGGRPADFLVEKQIHNAVRHQAPVLHGAGSKIGDGNLVHLGQRKFDAEHFFVESKSARREVQRETAVLDVLAWGSVDTDGNAEVLGLDVVEIADDEGEQVGGHQRRRIELDRLLRSAADFGMHLGLRGDIHVAQARQVLVRNQGDGELGFERGLIEAREGPAGVGGLELGNSHDARASIWVFVC